MHTMNSFMKLPCSWWES